MTDAEGGHQHVMLAMLTKLGFSHNKLTANEVGFGAKLEQFNCSVNTQND